MGDDCEGKAEKGRTEPHRELEAILKSTTCESDCEKAAEDIPLLVSE